MGTGPIRRHLMQCGPPGKPLAVYHLGFVNIVRAVWVRGGVAGCMRL